MDINKVSEPEDFKSMKPKCIMQKCCSSTHKDQLWCKRCGGDIHKLMNRWSEICLKFKKREIIEKLYYSYSQNRSDISMFTNLLSYFATSDTYPNKDVTTSVLRIFESIKQNILMRDMILIRDLFVLTNFPHCRYYDIDTYCDSLPQQHMYYFCSKHEDLLRKTITVLLIIFPGCHHIVTEIVRHLSFLKKEQTYCLLLM